MQTNHLARRTLTATAIAAALLAAASPAPAQIPVEKTQHAKRFYCSRFCTTFISATPATATVGTYVTITGHTVYGAGYTGTFDVSTNGGGSWSDSGFSGVTDSSGNVVITVTSAQPSSTLWRFNAAGHQSDPAAVSWV